MIIRYLPSFMRAYRKLEQQQRERVDRTITIFRQDPFDPRLRNHKIRLSKEDTRSISAGYDLRILYVDHKGIVALMLTVGTHDEVY